MYHHEIPVRILLHTIYEVTGKPRYNDCSTVFDKNNDNGIK